VRLVLDTNVVISALLNPTGKPSEIMKMILGRGAELYCNSAILSEYEKVALRPKFSGKINPNNIRRFIKLLESIGISFNSPPSSITLPDESDRIFYDTAKGSRSILISGNIKHFPKAPFIMTPSDFLKQANHYRH